MGIAHAQLPINKYVKMQTRKILTVNQGNLIFFVMKYSRTEFLKLDFLGTAMFCKVSVWVS